MTTQPQPEALPPLPTPDANRAEWDGGWRQYHDQHDLLPDQWDDEKPDSIVPLFTADQMRAYATEHAARLHAECDALRATQSDTLLRLLCDLRFALGDDGARMQHDLVEYARGLRADAERYRWLAPRMLAADFDWNESGECVLVFQWPRNIGVGGDCNRNIDAARAAKEQE